MKHSIQEGFYKIVTCRRSLIGLTGILACGILGLYLRIDTSGSVAMIVTAIAGANAAQAVGESRRAIDAPASISEERQ